MTLKFFLEINHQNCYHLEIKYVVMYCNNQITLNFVEYVFLALPHFIEKFMRNTYYTFIN